MNFKDTIYKYREIVESHLKDVYLSGPENMVETSNFVMSSITNSILFINLPLPYIHLYTLI